METGTKPLIRSRTRTRTCQSALFSLGIALVAPAARAALWETPSWALTANAEAGLGYDSNLYARKGGDDDGFASFTPSLRLFRRSSLTKFELSADAKAVKFFTYGDEDFIDPSLKLRYVYPDTEDTLSTQEVRASYVQSSNANSDVGRRLRQSDSELAWEGAVAATGKSLFEARTRVQRTDYREIDYNTNESVNLGATYNFVSHERLNLGAGYDLALSRSVPDSSGAQKTDGVSNEFTFRGRGDFLPKVNGRFHAGIASVSYTGAQDYSDWDIIAGAALAWEVTERLEISSNADRDSYYSPDGSVITRTGVSLQAAQTLAGGFTLRGQLDASQSEYVTDISKRRDNQINLSAGLKYAFTDRFSADASCSWTTQESDLSLYNYDRALVSGSVSCRF